MGLKESIVGKSWKSCKSRAETELHALLECAIDSRDVALECVAQVYYMNRTFNISGSDLHMDTNETIC